MGYTASGLINRQYGGLVMAIIFAYVDVAILCRWGLSLVQLITKHAY